MIKSKILALIVLVFASLASCKKGDNDPIVPFKSRTARLVNTWDFNTYIKSTKQTFTSSSTSINRLEEIKEDDIIVNTTTSNPSLSLNIREDGIVDRYVIDFSKEGEFLMVKQYSLASSYSQTLLDERDTVGTTAQRTQLVKTINTSKDIIERYEGNWNFLGGIEDEYKNKERVALNFTEITTTSQNTIDTVLVASVTSTVGTGTPTTETETKNTRATVTSAETDRFGNGEFSEIWALSRLASDRVIVERVIDSFESTNIKSVLNSDSAGVVLTVGETEEIDGASTTVGTETFILTPSGLIIEEDE